MDLRDILFVMVWEGTQLVMGALGEVLVSIFLVPPTWGELERRRFVQISTSSVYGVEARGNEVLQEMTAEAGGTIGFDDLPPDDEDWFRQNPNLAVMRDAVADLGGDPSAINPRVPAELDAGALTLSALAHWRDLQDPGALLGSDLETDRTASDVLHRFDGTDEASQRLSLHGERRVGSSALVTGSVTGDNRDSEIVRTIALAPGEVHVTASLGMLLSAMKGTIESELQRLLAERL